MACALVIEPADIATCRKRPVARPLDRNHLDRVVRGPRRKLGIQRLNHAIGQRVQRVGTVQGDQAQACALLEKDRNTTPIDETRSR